MEPTTIFDWATTGGSVLGGIGGVAGLFAFFQQRGDRRRQRELPPPELLDHILTLRSAAADVGQEPRDRDWFNREALVEAQAEINRLVPMVKQENLASLVRAINTSWVVARSCAVHSWPDGTSDAKADAERWNTYRRQGQAAGAVEGAADLYIKVIHSW